MKAALAILFVVFVSFTRLDGHKVWLNPSHVTAVQGGGQLGYHRGTLITAGGVQFTVRENVNQVLNKLGSSK